MFIDKYFRIKTKRGISIAVVLMVISVLSVITMAAVALGIRNLNFVKTDRYSTKAFYAAEAGLARAVSRIKSDNTWDGREPEVSGERPLTFHNNPLQSSSETFTVNVFNNFGSSSEIDAVRGIRVPAGSCYIYSEGYSANNTRRQVGVMMKKSNPFSQFGLFGDEGVIIRGNASITAYDSDTGQNAAGKADTGTNGSQAGALDLAGMGNPSSGVDGSLYVGPGSTLGSGGAISISGNPTITGTQNILSNTIPMPEVNLPSLSSAVLPSIPNRGTVNLSPGFRYTGTLTIRNHQTVVLSGPGTYILEGLDIAAQGEFKVDTTHGPVNLYMDGPINLTGGSSSGNFYNHNANSTPKPEHLQVYATPNCTVIKLGGNAAASMAVFAPDTAIELHGNADFYGAIVGKTIDIKGNPDFYYDIALQRANTPVMVVSIDSWQRF